MDPITAASAFATIISLIGQFRNERASGQPSDFNSFLTWLVETQHNELKMLVEGNAASVAGIEALLSEQQDVLVAKLESLDRALAAFASGIAGFSEVGRAINPDAFLSEQAISILRQYEAKGASKVLESPMYGGVILFFLDGQGGQLEIADQRFIEDDLNTLVELSLLRLGHNSKGQNTYLFTRTASQLVQQMMP
jgi:hypothetical protein